jgi:hypothetical protein
MQTLHLTNSSDTWSYIRGPKNYSPVKAYRHLLGSTTVHPTLKWIWKTKCQTKYKVFFWLLLQDRLNTRGMLRRRNMYLDSNVCEMCIRQREESLWHLFFRCFFAKYCWQQIGINIPAWLHPKRVVKRIKIMIGLPFAMDIIIIICWSVCSEKKFMDF